MGLARECDAGLIRQYRYEPYGDFERDVTGAVTGVEDGSGNALDLSDPNVSTDMFHGFQGEVCDPIAGLCYFRGRDYPVRLGRFLQRDPNQQALILASAMAYNAQTKWAFVSLSAGGQYSDGVSLYQFVGSNPITALDPMGQTILVKGGGGVGLGAVLYLAWAVTVRSAEVFALRVVGQALYYVYITAIAVAASAQPGVDMAAVAAVESEFVSWMAGQSEEASRHINQGFAELADDVASGLHGQDPKRWWEAAKGFRHTLSHARKWFGTNRLTSNQIREWGRLIDYVSRTSNSFQWTLRGQPTIARLLKIDGKWLCVQYYRATNELATAFIANDGQVAAMRKLIRGG